jgi:radical SAM protein with 4Fe4S-binding SPASM domain
MGDKQRPAASGRSTFRQVLRNAKKLFAVLGPERLTFRVTMADNEVHQPRALVDFFEDEFPGSYVHLEPALNLGDPKQLLIAYRSFATALIAMLRARRTIHLQHSNLLFKFKRDPQEIDFCGVSCANFYVTPDERITACSRALRSDDGLAETFLVGRIAGNLVLIDQESTDRLRVLTLNNFATCQECFARFNCKGGCPWLMSSLQASPETWSEYCAAIRDLTREYLVSRLEAGSNAPFNVASIDV